MDNILDKDLTLEEEQLLRKSLEAWKEETYASLMEEVSTAKESKIEELEEANIAYREELKEEYANKLITALHEMRDELKSEVLAEMVEGNPEIQVLEKVKELIAPLVSEEYYENTYAQTIVSLQKQIEELEEDRNLEEGAKTLANLIAPYSDKTQNLILALIKEGGPEEVTEQFYTIIENLESVYDEAKDEDEEEFDDEEDDEEDDDEDLDDEEDDDDEKEDKKKKSKKSKKSKKDEEKDDEEDKDDDEEMKSESFIEKGLSGLTEDTVRGNALRKSIKDML
jgi:hypothetical protein